MGSNEAQEFIKHMLGESNIDIELDAKDFEIIEKQTLDVIAPYYNGTRYFYGKAPTIDLSNFPEITAIHKVYETTRESDSFIQSLFFGQPGVYIWDTNTMDSYLQFVSMQTLYANFKPMRSQTWQYIKPKVYLHGYSGTDVMLECFVRPTKFTDIEADSMYYALAKEYALALAKEIVGRTRSKFTVAGSPYQLDGAQLLAEAEREKQSVKDRIIPAIRVF